MSSPIRRLQIPTLLLVGIGFGSAITAIAYIFDAQLGSNFLAEMFGIVLTVLVIDQLIRREERRRWARYGSKARNSVSDVIRDVLSEISISLTLVPEQLDLEEVISDATPTFSKFSGHQLKALADVAKEGRDAIKKRMSKGLLDGDFDEAFETQHARLNDLETKYGNHLTPDELTALLDLETSLGTLIGNLKIRRSYLRQSEEKDSEELNKASQYMVQLLEALIASTLETVITALASLAITGLLPVDPSVFQKKSIS